MGIKLFETGIAVHRCLALCLRFEPIAVAKINPIISIVTETKRQPGWQLFSGLAEQIYFVSSSSRPNKHLLCLSPSCCIFIDRRAEFRLSGSRFFITVCQRSQELLLVG